MTVTTKGQQRLRRRRRVRARVSGTAAASRASPSSAPTAGSSPSSSTTPRATPWPRSTGSSRTCARLTATDQAKKAGELLAERAKAAGVETCVFDRGGYQYHGRVKALADGAREGGLAF